MLFTSRTSTVLHACHFFEQAQTSTGCFFQTEGVTTYPEFWNDQQMADVTISLFYWSQQNQDK